MTLQEFFNAMVVVGAALAAIGGAITLILVLVFADAFAEFWLSTWSLGVMAIGGILIILSIFLDSCFIVSDTSTPYYFGRTK